MVGTGESDLVGDGLVDHDGDAGGPGDTTNAGAAPQRQNRQRPTLSGLGTRVEQILKLAEEQANDRRAEAQRESEAIVTSARQEAEAILNRAHEQAAGIAGTRPDLSAVRPAEAASSSENPHRSA